MTSDFVSNFVAFSQYVNFKNVKYLESRHSNDRGNGDENTVGTRFERRKKALFAIKVKWGRVLWSKSLYFNRAVHSW